MMRGEVVIDLHKKIHAGARVPRPAHGVGMSTSALAPAEGEDCRLTVWPVRDQLCFAVYSASHAFSRRYKPMLRSLGLTYPQYLCMLVLWEQDGLTVGAIGAELHLDSGTLTPLLKRLEGAGLIRRLRDARDERQLRIRLTDKGRSMATDASTLATQMICATGQPADDLFRLRDALFAIRDMLNGSGRTDRES